MSDPEAHISGISLPASNTMPRSLSHANRSLTRPELVNFRSPKGLYSLSNSNTHTSPLDFEFMRMKAILRLSGDHTGHRSSFAIDLLGHSHNSVNSPVRLKL